MTAPISRRSALRLIGRTVAFVTGAVVVGTGDAIAGPKPPIISPDDFIQYRAENNFMSPTIAVGDLVLIGKKKEPVQHLRLYAVPRREARQIITTAKWHVYPNGIPVPDAEYLMFMVRQGIKGPVDSDGKYGRSPFYAIALRSDDYEERNAAGYCVKASAAPRGSGAVTYSHLHEVYLGHFDSRKEHLAAHPIAWIAKDRQPSDWRRDHSAGGAS